MTRDEGEFFVASIFFPLSSMKSSLWFFGRSLETERSSIMGSRL